MKKEGEKERWYTKRRCVYSEKGRRERDVKEINTEHNSRGHTVIKILGAVLFL